MPGKPGSTGERSVNIGGDATGNIIQTGNRNAASLNYQRVSLPSPASVNIHECIKGIRATLAELGTPDRKKIENAMSEAEDELSKPEPDKTEVGQALKRALDYAGKAEGFVGMVEKLKPHVVNTASWLGSNWHSILSAVGLTT